MDAALKEKPGAVRGTTSPAAGYCEILGAADPAMPEKALMYAVLLAAIADYRGNVDRPNGQFRAAQTWLFGDDRRWLFSFKTVCEVLQVNASLIRKELLRISPDGRHRAVTRLYSLPESNPADRARGPRGRQQTER